MTVLDYTSVGVLSFSIFVNVSKKANADLQLLRLKTGDISWKEQLRSGCKFKLHKIV